MKSKPVKLTRIEALLRIILQKLGKKCRDEDLLKARNRVERQISRKKPMEADQQRS